MLKRRKLAVPILTGSLILGMLPCGISASAFSELTASDIRLEDTADVSAASQVQIIDGKAFLFDENGSLCSGGGTPVVGGLKYWTNSDGSLNCGWLSLSGWTLYFDPVTYAARTGLAEIGGKTYLFDANGVMQTGSGTPVIGGLKYWMNGDSSLNAGWLRFNGWQMYFDPVTYAARTGLTEIGGKTYMFDQNGVMQTTSGTPVINGSKYWINPDGSLSCGWLNMGSWHMYFDPEDYTAAAGLTEIDGKTYLFDQNGLLQTGSGTPVIGGSKYWMNSDSSLNSGWLNMGSWHMYFDPQTFTAKTGLCQVDGVSYLFDSNGLLFEGPGYVTAGNSIYYVSAEGAITDVTSPALLKAKQTLDQIGWSLEAAFSWAQNIPYYRNVPAPGTGIQHTEYYADYGFTNGTGHCYVKAATLYQMARLLGYDIHYVEGYVRSTNAAGREEHGWCEVIINGQLYVLDLTGPNGWMAQYGQPGTWQYIDYQRVS